MNESRRRAVGSVIAAVLDAVPESVILLDSGGTIVLVNRQLEALFGYRREELVGKPLELLLPPRLRALQHRQNRLLGPREENRPAVVNLALSGLRRDGTEVPIQVNLSAIETAGDALAMATVRTRSEQMEQERRLLEKERDLSILQSSERLTRDLHDDVTEHLFAAGLSLGSLLQRAADPDLQCQLAEALAEIDAAILAIRTVMFEVARASAEGSLRAKVLDICAEMLPALGSVPRVYFSGPLDAADPAMSEMLLPVLKEALANVARHAGATSVSVTLSLDEGLTLTVEDDGIGLDTAIRQAAGHGLEKMKAGARRAGGRLEVGPNNGSGTRLEWWAPAS